MENLMLISPLVLALVLPSSMRAPSSSRGVCPTMRLFQSLTEAFSNEDLDGRNNKARLAKLRAPATVADDTVLIDSTWNVTLAVHGVSSSDDSSVAPKGSNLKSVMAEVSLSLGADHMAHVTASNLTSPDIARWWLMKGELQVELTTPGIELTTSWRLDTGRMADYLGKSTYVVPAGKLYLKGPCTRLGKEAKAGGAVLTRLERNRFNVAFKEVGTFVAVATLDA